MSRPMTGSGSTTREAGSGRPIVFVHEFAGDHRSWEPQLRHFSRTHRCIAFSARGYPPSDVPEDPEMYSQDRARDDVLAVLDGLGIEQAHINGLSMGGFATLHFGLEYPDRALSLVVAGCGYGARADARERFVRETTEAADRMENETMAVFGKVYALGPTRVQYQNKDPRGWQEFTDQLCEHSSLGSANTMRGVQRRRPSLFDLEDRMRALTVPTLVLNGDEDEPCLDAGLFMKRTIASSALVPAAAYRTSVQSGRAGALQPGLRRFHRQGRGRALGDARPALDDRRDHLDVREIARPAGQGGRLRFTEDPRQATCRRARSVGQPTATACPGSNCSPPGSPDITRTMISVPSGSRTKCEVVRPR